MECSMFERWQSVVCVRRTAATALRLWPGNLDQLFLLFSIDKNAARCTGVAVAIMEKVMLMHISNSRVMNAHTSHTNFCHLWLQIYIDDIANRRLKKHI